MEITKPKIYFVCEHRGPEWVYCYGVLSNGFCFGQHICSHECFAPGDLYFRRSERISALKSVFGFIWEPGEAETINVRSEADIPDWWFSHMDMQGGLKDAYIKYNSLLRDK